MSVRDVAPCEEECNALNLKQASKRWRQTLTHKHDLGSDFAWNVVVVRKMPPGNQLYVARSDRICIKEANDLR